MMRRTINLLLMLLFVAEVTFANTVDFDKMYREADEKMYEDKRMRKKLAEETNTIES